MRASLIVLLSMVVPCCAVAQTPIAFNFGGTNPGQTNPWNIGTVIASGLSQPFVFGAGGPGWTRASGLGGSNGANRYNTTGWTTGTSLATLTTSLTTLIANNDYMGFGLSVNSGFAMNLNGASVGIILSRNGNGPDQYVVMSDLPGYGLLPTSTPMLTGTITGGNDANVTFVLPVTGLNGLTGSYEFRVYGLRPSSVAGEISVGIQNDPTSGFRIFNGTVVAIPEPMTVALLGLAVSGGVTYWRHRRRQALLVQSEDAAELDHDDD